MDFLILLEEEISNSNEETVKKFLSILSKENCPETERRIREAFYLEKKLYTIDPSCKLPIRKAFAKAVNALEKIEAKKLAPQNPESDKFIKKVLGMSNSLRKALDYAYDKEMITFFYQTPMQTFCEALK